MEGGGQVKPQLGFFLYMFKKMDRGWMGSVWPIQLFFNLRRPLRVKPKFKEKLREVNQI